MNCSSMDGNNDNVGLDLDCLKCFEAQDVKNGNFELIFEIGDKKLYAYKFRLATASKPFAAMLSKNFFHEQPIKIVSHSYDNFKNFLTFLYTDKCAINEDNIYAMVDLAEMYQISKLKEKCDEFLSQIEFELENAFKFYEFARKYNLGLFNANIYYYVEQNLSILIQHESFLSLKKESIAAILKFQRIDLKEENFFESIYKWAEHQCQLKSSKPYDTKKISSNAAMKQMLAKILPNIPFGSMNLRFIIEFIVPKGFLFSYEKLSRILYIAYLPNIEITDKHDNLLRGKLFADTKILENLQIVEGMASDFNGEISFWLGMQCHPSKPPELKVLTNISHYFVIDAEGDFQVKKTIKITKNDYLLAELTGNNEEEFYLEGECFFKIVQL